MDYVFAIVGSPDFQIASELAAVSEQVRETASSNCWSIIFAIGRVSLMDLNLI